MEQKCSECGGRLIRQADDILVCEKCGLEDSGSLMDTSEQQVPLYLLKSVPKRRWSPDAVFRNIKFLERTIRLNLPTDLSEIIVYYSKETFKQNYIKKIPKTRDKKTVLWIVYISWIIYSIKLFEKLGDSTTLNQLNKILEALEKRDGARFRKAEKIIEKIYKIVYKDTNREKLNQKKLLSDGYLFFTNIYEIDEVAKNVCNSSFFDLFYKTTPQIEDKFKEKNMLEVIRAGEYVAKFFLNNIVNRQILNKALQVNEIRNREGLLGACCYLVCEKNGLNPKNQSEWAKFFNISESSFEKLLRAIRTTEIIHTKTIS